MPYAYRKSSGRMVGGVCAGLADKWGMDPVVLRIAFVALALFNGVGGMIYLLAWLFLPEEGARHADGDRVVRDNAEEITRRARELVQQARASFRGERETDPWAIESDRPGGSFIVGVAIVALGLVMLLSNLGLLSWLTLGRLLPLALIAAGALLLANNLRRA